MTHLSDLPGTLPLFPLPGALLLPRARLPLHIFEPRYLSMLDDTLKTDARLIGMIQPQGETLASVGGAGRVTSFSEGEGGRYQITLTGISRFRVTEVRDGFAPYLNADVDWSEFTRDTGPAEGDVRFRRAEFLDLLARYFAAEGLNTDWGSLREAEPEVLINALSMLCPLPPEDKQALLEAPSLAARRETLETLMDFALRRGEDEVMQ